MNKNLDTVLKALITELNIPITKQGITRELERHPHYPSLLSISDILDNFQVPNGSYQLKFDQLPEIQRPFICLINGERDEFVLVKAIDEQKVIVSNERWRNHILPIEEFQTYYSGSVLIAEKGDVSGEIDYSEKRLQEVLNKLRIPFLIFGTVLCLIIFLINSSYFSGLSYQIGILTIVKSLGIATSILLLIQSLDANNSFIQKLCGSKEDKNCNAILLSKAAKISKGLSWSEIGFFYFSGTWFALLFSANHQNNLQVLAFLNLLCLPYTIYSIYFQWKIAKQWCLFCCVVQVLLWLEFLAFFPLLTQNFAPQNLMDWSVLVTALLIPLLFWIFFKPYFLLGKQVPSLKSTFYKFKYNTDLFQQLLDQQPKFALLNEDNSIVLGNRDSINTITVVSNPYCEPCAKVHKILNEWLDKRQDIKVQFVFSTYNIEEDPRTQFARHLMAIKSSENDDRIKKAMDDWYDQKQKDFNSWVQSNPHSGQYPSPDIIQIQKDWCNMVSIEATPTLFINGRRLPKPYYISDIKYFL